MNNKNSFTLIEMIISITLFSIIIIFLYSTLNIMQKSNQIYKDELNKIIKKEDIKLLLFEDLINTHEPIPLETDKEGNTILSFRSNNTYHNVFYTNILYIISKNKNLLRIESSLKYDKKKLSQFKNNKEKYVDIIQKDIKLFKVYQHKNKSLYTIQIMSKDKKDLLITINTI